MPTWTSILENIQRQIAEKWPHMVIFSVCVLCMGAMRWDSLTTQVQAHEVRLDNQDSRINSDHDLLVRTAQDVLDIHDALGLRRRPQ